MNLAEQRAQAEQALKIGRITAAEYHFFIEQLDLQEMSEGPMPETTPMPTAMPETSPDASPAIAFASATVVAEQTEIPDIPVPPPPQVKRAPKPESSRVYAAYAVMFLSVLIVSFLGWYALQNGGITANVVLNIPHANLTNATELPVDQVISGINVTGVMYGEGNATITFVTPNGTLLVTTITSDNGLPRTELPSYLEGQPVNIEHAPLNASYYLDDGAAGLPVTPPFSAPATNSTLIIVANESGNLATYHVPILIGSFARETPFDNACLQSCEFSPTNGTLVITTEGTTVGFSSVDAAGIAYEKPTLITPYGAVLVNDTVTVDLDGHFASQAPLLYSTGSSDLVFASVNGSVLTLTPHAAGNGTITIYASDLAELVSAEMPIVVEMPSTNVIENTTPNSTTNITVNFTPENITAPNTTANETNATIALNETTNATNATNLTLDCSSPDPNMRPVECLQQNTSFYFPNQDVFLENSDRVAVARFNELGNMLIKGTVVEHATRAPATGDFIIGQPDINGNIAAVIWIDATGNLNLRGALHEEEVSVVPPPGSYSIMTKRGIYLMYADRSTGDLYLRGNLIPYRRSIE